MSASESAAADNRDRFVIHSANCLSCSRLIPELENGREFKKCFDGNEECPALYTKMIIGVPVDKIVRLYNDAVAKGDVRKMGNILRRLEDVDKALVDKIFSSITSK